MGDFGQAPGFDRFLAIAGAVLLGIACLCGGLIGWFLTWRLG